MFTDAQKDALAAKLDRSTVKTREQAGRTFSYIEGWHAVAECNRIFGFDGWSRETLEMRCVWEGARNDKQAAYYTAKVRVTVRAGEQTIVREGTGSGSGFDRDLGAAHESAIKEAETDAMKRALMTFGNPFGLALYDKTQADVEGGGEKKRPPPPARTTNVEKDRHFGNAADEIRSGENGIPGGQAPANTDDMSAREWANSLNAHKWIQGTAVVEIKAIGNPKSVTEWQQANAESMDALSKYCTKRHAWLMDKINEHLDYLTNLRAAG